MRKIFPSLLSISLIIVIFFTACSLSWGFSLAQNVTPTVVAGTEAPGGLLGSLTGDLRCPVNLSGIGPVWRNIRVGVSTLGDWKAQFAPYVDYIQLVTPDAPLGTPAPLVQKYASYYKTSIYRENNVQLQLNLPGIFGACIVDGKVQAFFISTENITDVPHHIDQLISLLGSPERISWNEGDQYARVLHWPKLGISADVDGSAYVLGMYYYPYQSGDDHWPMNALLEELKLSLYPGETITLEHFDQARDISLEDIEATVTSHPVWPTRTPNAIEGTPAQEGD